MVKVFNWIFVNYKQNIKSIFLIFRDYSQRDPEGVMANWIGVLIIVFGVMVVYLATNYKYKRLPRPEDEMLLNETHAQDE